MKQQLSQLSSWWLKLMVPEPANLTTLGARERLRKRGLFSLILLASLLCYTFFGIVGFFTDSPMLQQLMDILGGSVVLFALLLNRKDYFRWASVCFFAYAFLGTIETINSLSQMVPFLSLFLWAVLPLFLIVAGLFLTAWGPLSLGILEIVFLCWFAQARQHELLLFLKTPSYCLNFLLFTIMVVLLTMVFSALYSSSTRRAVIQADRAMEIEQAHNKLSDAYALIQKQALTDGLTGLPNHRAVMDQLTRELERSRRHERPLSVLFFDADRFKQVNDTYGHAAGDAVLRQIGERAGSVLRGDAFLGRFGGEEFVLLLPEVDASEAGLVAERIRAAVAAQPVPVPELEDGILMTVSVGQATYPTDGDHEQSLLKQADEAMYVAKRLGRNQVRTAEEARRMHADMDLMALWQQEGRLEAAQREGVTPEQLKEMYTLKGIYSLMALVEGRDASLSMHSYAVRDLAMALAEKLGLEAHVVTRIGLAALLHDIGKVGVPDKLLQQSSVLSSQDRERLRKHAELGAQILEASPLLYDLMPIVRHHHERWDGCGYPDELGGQDIPQGSRIIAVAEAFDSIQRDYPYQKARSVQEALTEVQRCAGNQFDPAIVQVLEKVVLTQHALAA